MPYRVSKELGGDSPENTEFIEKCVNAITGKNPRTGKPYTEGEKIAICKSALKKKKEEAQSELDNLLYRYIKLNIKRGIGYIKSAAMFNALLAKADYDLDIVRDLIAKEFSDD